jgi:hypothetical protein
LVRPKAGTLITIRSFIPPKDSDTLRQVLLIGVAVAALALGPGLGVAIGLGAGVGQALIGIGGMLLVNALIPPKTPEAGINESATRFIENARNTANPFGVVPVLFGRRRIVPALGADPITETVGDDQYLRMLFVHGIGPRTISEPKIGETLLSDFDDVQIEYAYGFDTDDPLTLYPSTVDQQNFQIVLSEPDGYTTRTTSENADEVGIDFVFPSGLITVATDGTRTNRSVSVQVQYSVAGAGIWNNIPVADGTKTFPASWTNESGGAFNTIAFTAKKTTAIRHGFTFKVPVRGQYDIRIKRTTADSSSDTIRDIVVWSALKRITNTDPVQSPVPVAKTALRIKATDQLSGVIDQFSTLDALVCLDWDTDTTTWIERETRNPASLYRYALQNDGLQEPYDDDEIDLETLQYWHEFNVTQGFEYNENRDYSSTLYDVLVDIAASGRASPQNIDGKWSVVIDEPKVAVSHVTPRNSSGFRASKMFVDTPHGIRVQFNNEDQDYANDEVRLYLDGYSAETATVFEVFEKIGVTSASLIAKHARFDAAVAVHRPEQWQFNMDMERLVFRRGDVIKITHDVISVGLAFGRLKSVTLDMSGDCTGVSVDEALDLDLLHSYGMSIRTPDDPALLAQVVAVDALGTHDVTFTTPIPAADIPEVGDLFGFGYLGQETDDALVLSIEALDSAGFNAQIICVPYREIVYTIDSETIPPFVSNITLLTPVPDVTIESIRSDESVLTVGAGESLSVNVAIKVQALTNQNGVLDVQIRPSATEDRFTNAKLNIYGPNEVFIGDVRSNEYVDIRLRWLVDGRLPGAWTYVYNHRVIGKSSDPDPLNGMTIQTFGGQAFIRWDKPRELDVQFGGEVRFRHSTDPAPVWANSISIGNVARAKSLVATLPLKPGTYLARVFDDNGNQSTTTSVDSAQASVLLFAPVDSVDEATAFVGTHDGTAAVSSLLQIAAIGMWDDIPDIDAEPAIDTYGGIAAQGTYTFAQGFDFLTVKRVRLTARVNATNGAITDNIDDWAIPIDERDDFDGSDLAPCDCAVYVRTTPDNPAGSPTWTEWQRLDAMEVEARGCQFKAVLTSTNVDFNIFVSELGIDAEEVV